MTIRYVGPGGSDGADGLSWANRKLTLNGVEDTPVVAGDTVYVGAGTYREELTVDVTGTSGNIITYIGDVTGEYTDGIGGIVRLTGLDTDDGGNPARLRSVTLNGKNYRTFMGFTFDNHDRDALTNSGAFYMAGACDNIIIEDCVFCESYHSEVEGSVFTARDTNSITNVTFRRCLIVHAMGSVYNQPGVDRDHDVLWENCLIYRGGEFYLYHADGMEVQHCSVYSWQTGYMVQLTGTGTGQIYDSMTMNVTYGLTYIGTITVTDDYNQYWPNKDDDDGANTIVKPILFKSQILYSGFRFPYNALQIRNYPDASLRQATNTNVTEDLYGIARAPSGKRMRGALELQDVIRDTSTVSQGSTSIKIQDAGYYQFMIPVVGGSRLSIGVDALYEADYTGTLPQLTIKRTQYSDQTITATAPPNNWDRLDYSFRPDDDEQFISIELRSNNTATTGSFATYFDAISIKSGTGKKIPLNWISKYRPVYRLVSKSQEDEWVFGDVPFTPGAGTVIGPFPTFFRST